MKLWLVRLHYINIPPNKNLTKHPNSWKIWFCQMFLHFSFSPFCCPTSAQNAQDWASPDIFPKGPLGERNFRQRPRPPKSLREPESKGTPATTPKKEGLSKGLLIILALNKALLGPCFIGGVALAAPSDSHKWCLRDSELTPCNGTSCHFFQGPGIFICSGDSCLIFLPFGKSTRVWGNHYSSCFHTVIFVPIKYASIGAPSSSMTLKSTWAPELSRCSLCYSATTRNSGARGLGSPYATAKTRWYSSPALWMEFKGQTFKITETPKKCGGWIWVLNARTSLAQQ